MPIPTKEALETIAKQKGVSLSLLMLSAAVDRYLLTGKQSHVPLESVRETSSTKEQTQSEPIEKEVPLRPLKAIDSYETLHINALAPRLMGEQYDKMLKSRLSIVGSYDRLFNVDDKKNSQYIKKVEEFTSERDPEGKSWFPTDRTRQKWVQMTGAEFKQYLRS